MRVGGGRLLGAATRRCRLLAGLAACAFVLRPAAALARAGGGQVGGSGSGGASSAGGGFGAMGAFSSFGECLCYFLFVIVGLAVLAWLLGRGTKRGASGAGSAGTPPDDDSDEAGDTDEVPQD